MLRQSIGVLEMSPDQGRGCIKRSKPLVMNLIQGKRLGLRPPVDILPNQAVWVVSWGSLGQGHQMSDNA